MQLIALNIILTNTSWSLLALPGKVGASPPDIACPPNSSPHCKSGLKGAGIGQLAPYLLFQAPGRAEHRFSITKGSAGAASATPGWEMLNWCHSWQGTGLRVLTLPCVSPQGTAISGTGLSARAHGFRRDLVTRIPPHTHLFSLGKGKVFAYFLIFGFHSDFATRAFFYFHFDIGFFLIRDPSSLLSWRRNGERKGKERKHNTA